MSLYIGLLSGTSADAIDGALVEFAGDQLNVIATLATTIEAPLKAEILDLYQPGMNEIDRLGSLDRALGESFAQCATELMTLANVKPTQVTAIGSHGQTVRHRPRLSSNAPFTLQIGDPNTIAERTGVTTVADFRRRDLSIGGQGAPLTPAFHQAFFAQAGQDRAVLNLGGIANVTTLPAKGQVWGFDTGPSNGLMDSWIAQSLGKAYDQNGGWAASGTVRMDLLQQLLAHPFFDLPPPKSTGREEFTMGWVQEVLSGFSPLPGADVQATLLALTVQSISDCIQQHCAPATEVFACGGGVHNDVLMQKLKEALPGFELHSTEALGIPPDWVEAVAFAWLAMRTLGGMTGNLPTVTGAKREVPLGGIYPGR